MPDLDPSQPSGQPTSQSAPTTPSSDSFQLPEKFAGKPPEEIAKAYLELERKFGETSGKLKGLEGYSSLGATPEQITQVIEYARNLKSAMDQGLLVPKGQSQPSPTQPSSDPWKQDDWAFKSPQEQFDALAAALEHKNRSYIDERAETYGKEIQRLAQNDARQKELMLRAVKLAITNPGADPETLLAQAAELGTKSPEELMNMALDSLMNTPDKRQADIDKIVAEKVALRLQEEEAKRHSDFLSTSLPARARLGSGKAPTSREQENRQIIDSLAKQGIRF